MGVNSRVGLWFALGAALITSGSLYAQEDDYLSRNLIPNGDFEQGVEPDGWPVGWPRAASAVLKAEDGNHYLSLKPYGGPSFEFPLEPDWIGVRVSCRVRCTGLKVGAEGWHDARMVMSWNDAKHQHVDPWPDVVRGEGTFGWTQMERTFTRPPGAAFLSIGPQNFGAEGVADYDDIVVQGKRRPPLRDLPLPKGAETVWDTAKAWRRKSATQEEVCLNGVWQFRPATTAQELDAVPQEPGWGWFKVPASWSDDRSVRVRPAEAWEETNVGDLKAAWYRREFTCPAEWQDRKVELRLDLVQTRAQAFIDGKAAGEVLWPGGTLDITALCRPGQKQALAVLALAVPLSRETQTFMGPDRVFTAEAMLPFRGLCGDVFLRASPKAARIEDVFVQTSVGDAKITLDTSLTLPAAGAFTLRARVEHDDRAAKEFSSGSLSARDLSNGRFAFSAPWPDAPLWDVDDPQFCTLHLALTDAAGKVLDEALPLRFAFREFVVKGRDFHLNGKRIHLRAVILNSATNADAGSVEGARNTFRRMRKYGFNFFIMTNYHFRPGEVGYFLDMIRAADEEGMLLSFSLPHLSDFGWNLDDAGNRARYQALTDWCIKQVRHHPSVILYAMNHNATGYMGDQDPALLDGLQGPDNSGRRQALVAQGIAEALDPTRPVYHHQSGNLGDFITLNCYLNWAPIRERSRWLSVWAARAAKPFFFVEWGLPHISSWSSYRGPNFIWTTPALQQAWSHEFAAAFKGDAAYEVDADDVESLKTELRFWERNEPFGWWNLSGILGRKETNVIEIKSLFASKNWPAHRTWGISAMLPWDQEDMWRHKEGAPSRPLPLDTDWEAIQRPGLSPDLAGGGDSYLYSRYPEDDWEPRSLGRTFMRVNMPLLAYLGGKAEDFTEEGHNFLPGETVRKQVVVINDTRTAVRCTYKWGLEGGPEGAGELEVEPGGIRKEPLGFRLPSDLQPGAHRLGLSVAFPGGETQEDGIVINVMQAEARPALRAQIALFDPIGKTRAALGAIGVPFTQVTSADGLEGYSLLIVGREALSTVGSAPDIAAVRDGLSVLVFEQTEEALQHRLGFRTQTYGLRQVFPRVPDHPVLAGLPGELLHDWRGNATLYPEFMENPGDYDNYPSTEWCGFTNTRVWRCGTGGNVATALIEKPARGDFLPIVDGGFDLQYAPLLEYREGKGRIVFCQMDVTARTEDEPAARHLVRNLLSYCAAPAGTQWRTPYYAGSAEGRDTLVALGVRPQDPGGRELGRGDVLILGPGAPLQPDLGKALSQDLNVLILANSRQDLVHAPVPCRAEVRTVVSSRLKTPNRHEALSGLSNAETHFRDFRDLPVLLDQAADSEGLLLDAPLDNGKAVFCQVAPWMFDPAKYPHDRTTYRRTAFMLGRILSNLGVPMETPLLANWARPAMVVPGMTAGWKGKPDPDNAGLQEGWQKAEFGDADWPAINVPGTWESQRPELADYNGIFWYRKTFDFPVVLQGVEMWLIFGAVDDEDWTYLNGQLIGSTTAQTNPDDHWAVERRYRVPPELLKPAGNLLAVRVNDTYLGGGIVRAPVAIKAPGRWQWSYYADAAEAGDDPYRYYRW